MYISKIEGWYSVDFLRDGYIAPRTLDLPSASVTWNGEVYPQVATAFTTVKLPVAFTDWHAVNYLRITYNIGAAVKTLYAWTDAVTLLSDGDYSVTQIQYTIDYWGSYIDSVGFGYGCVTRRPESTNDPPQDVPYRFVTTEGCYEIGSDTTHGWVVGARVGTHLLNGTTYTFYHYFAFPVSKTTPSINVTLNGLTFPSLTSVLAGSLEEEMEWDPDSLLYVAYSPVAPGPLGSGGLPSGWGQDDASSFSVLETLEISTSTFGETTHSVGDTWYSDDYEFVSVTNFDGTIVKSLPWGFRTDTVKTQLYPGDAGISMHVTLYDSSGGKDFWENASEGLDCWIQLPSLPITSNAMSSYVYSGARYAYQQQLLLSAASAYESTTNNLAGTVASGAISGSLAGLSTGLTGALIGATAGAAVSALSTEVTATLQAKYASGEYLEASMAIEDYSHANQAAGVNSVGSGCNAIVQQLGYCALVRQEIDTYSLTNYERYVRYYGVTVSEPTGSCQSLIDIGGPLQIQHLVVTGTAPAEAKRYITDRFNNGVYLQ